MQVPKKIILIGGLVLIALTAIAFFTLRKNGESGKSPEENVPAGSEEIQAILDEAGPEVPYVPTSLDKIEDAFSAGKIDAEKFAILEITAAFSPEKLPTEYLGAEDRDHSPDYIFGFIHEKWSTFSAGTKEVLLPYLLPPNDPKSFFYGRPPTTSMLNKFFGITRAKAAGPTEWVDIQPMENATVSYKKVNETRDFHPAGWASDTLQIAVPKYQNLLGVNMKKVHVFINDPELIGKSYGYAVMSETVNGLCSITIKGGMNEKITRSTTAHELFHCFQHFMGLNYGNPELKWLTEATATWSEDFIYKNFQTEHEYDTSFLNHTVWDLLDRRDEHHYGSYMWFYFLTQNFGPEQVALTLNKSKNGEPRQALSATQDFPENFKKFVFWNWNYSPFKEYKDADNEPNFSKVHPGGNSFKRIPVKTLGNFTEKVELAKASSKYILYYFPAGNIKKIEFDNKELLANEQGTRALQAAYKVGDNWYYEDWSDLEKRTFCRDIDAENVEAVVIIPSNSNVYLNTGGNLKLKTEKKCNPGWRGTIRVNWSMNNNLNPNGSWRNMEKGSYSIMEELEYDSERDSIDVKTSSFTASYTSSEIMQLGADACTPYRASGANISGAATYEYTKENSFNNHRPARFYGTEILEPGKLGGTYTLGLGILDPPVASPNPLHGTGWGKRITKNCTFILSLPDFSANIDSTEPIKDPTIYSVNPVDIAIAPGTKRIKGSDKFEIHSGVFGTVEWDFQRIE